MNENISHWRFGNVLYLYKDSNLIAMIRNPIADSSVAKYMQFIKGYPFSLDDVEPNYIILMTGLLL